ncbi:uncharacterized protein LOC130824742 [Amaranthus tricolor]|uniref:uncharacterized protein LOC130824742 n=1 Tax=Amaranthus tricolor TaxID=29722 RepID=UPI002587767E|nr:uncharacterized protein LOC130824742 [Amaranthus tricolor]
MCPLRFILVFFSAILAGFLAWRSFRSSPELDIVISDDGKTSSSSSSIDHKQERSFKMIIQDGFWVFVDMASGRYLWRNFKGMNMKTMEKTKSC